MMRSTGSYLAPRTDVPEIAIGCSTRGDALVNFIGEIGRQSVLYVRAYRYIYERVGGLMGGCG